MHLTHPLSQNQETTWLPSSKSLRSLQPNSLLAEPTVKWKFSKDYQRKPSGRDAGANVYLCFTLANALWCICRNDLKCGIHETLEGCSCAMQGVWVIGRIHKCDTIYKFLDLFSKCTYRVDGDGFRCSDGLRWDFLGCRHCREWTEKEWSGMRRKGGTWMVVSKVSWRQAAASGRLVSPLWGGGRGLFSWRPLRFRHYSAALWHHEYPAFSLTQAVYLFFFLPFSFHSSPSSHWWEHPQLYESDAFRGHIATGPVNGCNDPWNKSYCGRHECGENNLQTAQQSTIHCTYAKRKIKH